MIGSVNVTTRQDSINQAKWANEVIKNIDWGENPYADQELWEYNEQRKRT